MTPPSGSLGPVARRVLGCLVEKESTVPASYPMSLNGVVTACNQASGRDPVMALEPREVETALDELRDAGFVRRVHASHGTRVVKYRHVAGEVLGVGQAELAVLALLLLRGPQTPGELRGRAERIHAFAGVDEVAAVLAGLAGRDEPLVVELARRPGQKEQRWIHLLGGADPVEAAAVPGPAATGSVTRLEPFELPPELAPLAPFVGRWVGKGSGSYPTIDDFRYRHEVEFAPVPAKPFLTYRSRSRNADDDLPRHAESGFLRLVDAAEGAVELVIAQASGVVEVCEGLVSDGDMVLASTAMAGTSTAKDVTATDRRYQVVGDVLTYELSMAAVGVPLTHHLAGRLQRR